MRAHLPCTCEMLSERAVGMSLICEIDLQAGAATELVTLARLVAQARLAAQVRFAASQASRLFAAQTIGLQHRWACGAG